MTPDAFFIGWQRRVAPGLRRFLLLAVVAVPLGGGVLGLLLAAAADDPAGPRFALVPGAPMPLPLGETSLTGVLSLAPYPVLHLAPDAAAPRGRSSAIRWTTCPRWTCRPCGPPVPVWN
jgi:hypothetical protein